jgi:hypothetical protein
MAKILTDIEMAEIVRRTVHDGDLIEDAAQYAHFLGDLGDLLCTHFGGERGRVSGPDYPGDELGWVCAFHINDCVPDDGGVFAKHDIGVVWLDGREVQA